MKRGESLFSCNCKIERLIISTVNTLDLKHFVQVSEALGTSNADNMNNLYHWHWYMRYIYIYIYIYIYTSEIHQACSK